MCRDTTRVRGTGDREVGPPRVRRVDLARVQGESMAPGLCDGDLLLVRRARPQVGRVAVVQLPTRTVDEVVAVKRLAALLPEGWWVERDNPSTGVDSWQVGALAPERVLALVVLRLWPPRMPGAGSRWRRRRKEGGAAPGGGA